MAGLLYDASSEWHLLQWVSQDRGCPVKRLCLTYTFQGHEIRAASIIYPVAWQGAPFLFDKCLLTLYIKDARHASVYPHPHSDIDIAVIAH
jgi:hypothetical protein